MKLNIFDIIKNITQFKCDWDPSFKKAYSQTMINSYFSNFHEIIEIIEEITQYQITDEQHYNFLKDIIPEKSYFCKFKVKKDEDKMLEDISDYYKVNENISKQYLKLMSIEQYNEIKDKLKVRREMGLL
jgi:hypothetical protein